VNSGKGPAKKIFLERSNPVVTIPGVVGDMVFFPLSEKNSDDAMDSVDTSFRKGLNDMKLKIGHRHSSFFAHCRDVFLLVSRQFSNSGLLIHGDPL